MEVILATNNDHKAREIQEYMVGTSVRISAIPDNLSESFRPVESGSAFLQNARIKAEAAGRICKGWILSDDSGLIVRALGGRPGLHSANYAESDQQKVSKLLAEMEGQNDRFAAFICVLCLLDPAGNATFFCGYCPGSITTLPSGSDGFGFDPVFQPAGISDTFASMSMEQKSKLSHRGRALARFREFTHRLPIS